MLASAMPISLLEQYMQIKSPDFLLNRSQALQRRYPQRWWLQHLDARRRMKEGKQRTKAALLRSFANVLDELEQVQTYSELKALIKQHGDSLANRLKCPLTDPHAAGQSTSFCLMDFFADENRFTNEHMPRFDAHDAECQTVYQYAQFVCGSKDCKISKPTFATLEDLRDHYARTHRTSKFVPCIKCPAPGCSHTFSKHGRPNILLEHFIEQHSFADAFMCATKNCNRIFWRKSKAEEHLRKMHDQKKCNVIISIERWDVFLLFLGQYAWARDLCAQYLKARVDALPLSFHLKATEDAREPPSDHGDNGSAFTGTLPQLSTCTNKRETRGVKMQISVSAELEEQSDEETAEENTEHIANSSFADHHRERSHTRRRGRKRTTKWTRDDEETIADSQQWLKFIEKPYTTRSGRKRIKSVSTETNAQPSYSDTSCDRPQRKNAGRTITKYTHPEIIADKNIAEATCEDTTQHGQHNLLRDIAAECTSITNEHDEGASCMADNHGQSIKDDSFNSIPTPGRLACDDSFLQDLESEDTIYHEDEWSSRGIPGDAAIGVRFTPSFDDHLHVIDDAIILNHERDAFHDMIDVIDDDDLGTMEADDTPFHIKMMNIPS